MNIQQHAALRWKIVCWLTKNMPQDGPKDYYHATYVMITLYKLSLGEV